MRELELTFLGKGEVKGYEFQQISDAENWYIYQVSRENKISHYEVFKRKEIKAVAPFAPEDYVAYPKANSFGISAWTAKTLERAYKIVKDKTSIHLNEPVDDLSNQSSKHYAV